MAHRQQKQQGVVLIQVLWVMAILTVITGSIAYIEGLDLRINRLFLQQIRARWAAEAGIETAISQLALHGHKKFNHAQLSWWSGNEIYAEIVVGNASFTVSPPSPDAPSEDDIPCILRYGLTDFEALINPNTAPQEVLERVPGMTLAMAKGIVGLRGVSPPAPLPTPQPDSGDTAPCAAPFAFLEQLTQVGGIDMQVLYGNPGGEHAGLAQYLSVRSNGRVNINTASAQILECLGLRAEEAQRVVAARTRGEWFRSVPEFTAAYPGTIAPQLLDVRSTNFTLTSVGRAQNGSSVTIRAHLNIDQQRVRVLEKAMQFGEASPMATRAQ